MSLLENKFHISTGQEIQPDRHALLALFVAFVFSISPHVTRLPAWYIVIAVIVFSWCYRIISAKGHHPGSLVRIIFLAAVIFLLFRQYHTLLGRDAGVAMLIALTMLKFLELKSLRDYMLVVFLCMFIVLTSFLYSQSIWLGIYLLAVVIILFTVMMYLNHSVRLNISAMLKRAASLVISGLPVAVLLFLLFPRLQSGLFVLPGDSHSGQTGMSDTMQPGSINELNLSEKVAFRAEFSGRVPVMKQRYWRGLVLENYEQGVWKESSYDKGDETAIQHVFKDVVKYSTLQEPSNQKWIFSLDMPVKKPPNLQWGTGYTLRSNSVLRERHQQQLKSALVYSFAGVPEAELASNIDVSSVTGKRIRELAQSIYLKSGNDRNYVNAVLDYYSKNEFIYSLKPPLLGKNPVESFMLDTRKGYCEHFASSFTIMMRLAGIPARVVIGYQGGEWNDQGKYMIIRQSDAHAWSEVWLDDSGWVRIDPTSAVAPERIEYGLSAIRQLVAQGQELGNLTDQGLQLILQKSFFSKTVNGLRLFWDGVNTRWYKWVIGYGTENQDSILKWLGFKGVNERNLVILLVALVFLVLSIQAWILFYRRKAVDPAVRQYQKFCQRLSRVGIDRFPSEGPADFASRVISLRPDLKRLVSAVTESYIAILYAGKTDAGQQQELTRAVHEFRPKMLKL